MTPDPYTEGDIGRRIQQALPPRALQMLEEVAALSGEIGMRAYLVGGSVRDILLDRPHFDLDISIEGDAPTLARHLQERANAEIVAVHRFGTVELAWHGPRHLDLVTARREWYLNPGALPVVAPGTIEDDLARRDFSINAMAIEISPAGVGRLLDPHGGAHDLRQGWVCVLHDSSFIDDPTRIPRAVKYAVRLGFKIESRTMELIFEAVRDGALATVSYDRIMREILLVMQEPRAGAMLCMLRDTGVLRAIHPDLDWPYPANSPIPPGEDVALSPEQRRDVYLALLGAEYASDPPEAAWLARSLSLDTGAARLMRDAAELSRLWPTLGEPQLAPSQVANLLRPLDTRALQAFAHMEALAKDEPAWERLHTYLDTWRHIRPAVGGDFLHLLGVPPGPLYRDILTGLRDAKLDGLLPTRADEERFVRDRLDHEQQ